MSQLFSSNGQKAFHWKDVETFWIRSQYNELLKFVSDIYFHTQYVVNPSTPPVPGDYAPNNPVRNPNDFPGFLNINRCFTLTEWDARCQCTTPVDIQQEGVSEPLAQFIPNNEAYKAEAISNLKRIWQPFMHSLADALISDKKIKGIDQKIEKGIESKEDIEAIAKAFTEINAENQPKKPGDPEKISTEWVGLLENAIDQVKKSFEKETAYSNLKEIGYMLDYFKAQEELNAAVEAFKKKPTPQNADALKASKKYAATFHSPESEFPSGKNHRTIISSDCHDTEPNYLCLPKFLYQRKIQNRITTTGGIDKIQFLKFQTENLTVGSVIWLYNYERMGTFKILGALMNDYNYKGKYTISGNRSTNTLYSRLMDMICTLHRTGISSTLRDRVCTYQRVLGVDIENNLGIESDRNEGFMENFKKLMDNMLEYYDAKRLAKAIQNSAESKSSVATQTSILDTIRLLKEQFEPFQYGRNQINTFLGIATVHATLCLVNMLRKEIGIPDQYNKPEEFIPAAYDILVAKRQVTRTTTNRFIVYDNCASYGYRLLTDIEIANINEFNISDTNSNLTIWLDDVESIVEGYRSAYASVPERAVEMV